MAVEGKISEADLDLLRVTDSTTEARDIILDSARQQEWSEEHEEGARAATRKAFSEEKPES
jgi:predicted Rossmann-fold nucleotide-binding protein